MMIKFRIVRKDGKIVADKLLPSELFKLIKEGRVKHPILD
jgi:hypothetical protein